MPPDSTMYVGLHGRGQLAPWASALPSDERADIFDLVTVRAQALGLAMPSRSLSPDHAPQTRWSHNDAGGSWESSAPGPYQLAWLQAYANAASGHPAPVQLVASVLRDCLNHAGSFDLSGMHAVVPLHIGTADIATYAGTIGWFLQIPATLTSPLLVSVRSSFLDSHSVPSYLSHLRAREFGIFDIGLAPDAPRRSGLPSLLAGDVPAVVPADVRTVDFLCSAPAFSVDSAAWIIEVFADAARELGAEGPALIRVEV